MTQKKLVSPKRLLQALNEEDQRRQQLRWLLKRLNVQWEDLEKALLEWSKADHNRRVQQDL